jgi:branched-chain amino acid transport system ATP-binding protein
LAAKRLANTKIEIVLKDIEAAAQVARRRRSKPVSQQHAQRPAPAIHAAPEGPPPIIEVYKRPLVEVYRRRPSGQFERD